MPRVLRGNFSSLHSIFYEFWAILARRNIRNTRNTAERRCTGTKGVTAATRNADSEHGRHLGFHTEHVAVG